MGGVFQASRLQPPPCRASEPQRLRPWPPSSLILATASSSLALVTATVCFCEASTVTFTTSWSALIRACFARPTPSESARSCSDCCCSVSCRYCFCSCLAISRGADRLGDFFRRVDARNQGLDDFDAERSRRPCAFRSESCPGTCVRVTPWMKSRPRLSEPSKRQKLRALGRMILLRISSSMRSPLTFSL